MVSREDFARRIRNAAQQYRRELIAAGEADDVLDPDAIIVKETEHGVEVVFYATSSASSSDAPQGMKAGRRGRRDASDE